MDSLGPTEGGLLLSDTGDSGDVFRLTSRISGWCFHLSPPFQLALSALVAAFTLCTPSSLPGQVFERRDSAGVQVVVTGPSPEITGPTWTIVPEPILQIGEIEGTPPFLFSRLWDALRAPDGRLVVVDANSYEIRVFGSDGQHEVTFGRRGGGPREFGGPPWVFLDSPDTLTAWDPGHHRVSWYSLSGDLLEQKSLVSQLSALSIVPFRNGRVWQVGPNWQLLSTRSASDQWPGEGLKETTNRFVLFDGVRETSVDFGSHPSGQMLWIQRGESSSLRGMLNPFSAFAAATIGPDPYQVSVAHAERWEIRSFDNEGTLRRVLRSTISPSPVTREVLARERADLPDLARRMGINLLEAERAFDRLPVPEALSPIASMFWDISGNLWVGRRSGDLAEAPRRYDVFDYDGQWLTLVEIPEEIEQIFEVGEDYVLAPWQDELDVPYLRVYSLEKTLR